MLRADHPSNNKTGGVCILYRTNLVLRVLNISYLSECITFEISIGNKVCRLIHLYRSPSQTQDEFQTFKSNLKLNLDALLCGNPFLSVMIGDFNAKSKSGFLIWTLANNKRTSTCTRWLKTLHRLDIFIST